MNIANKSDQAAAVDGKRCNGPVLSVRGRVLTAAQALQVCRTHHFTHYVVKLSVNSCPFFLSTDIVIS